MPEATTTRQELATDADAVEALQRAAFGPGAYARAAFRVREQAGPDPALSFVVEQGGALIASVRMTPIRVGGRPGLLLGPLVVDPCCKGHGHGKALVRLALEKAEAAGHDFVLLVGDAPYYEPLGFKPLPYQSVAMPGPADPARLLVAELTADACAGLAGTVTGWRAASR